MKNILLIKLRYIGDVVLTMPVIRRLREQYPDSKIVCLVNAGTEEVLLHNPHVDEVLMVERRGLLEQIQFGLVLRKRQFDCVIDLTDGDRSAFLSWVSGAKLRVGFNREHRWRGRLYSHCVDVQDEHRHMVDQHAQALRYVGGNSAVVDHPKVYVEREHEERAHVRISECGFTERRWVMIHPTARYWFKSWPTERFAVLCDRLSAEGLAIALVGHPQDQEVGTNIQEMAKAKVISLIGRTSLLELAALMKQAALFVGNDTGLMHIAAAVGCPVLGLFGPTNPEIWGPRGTISQVIYKGLDCRECFYPGCFRGEENCMKQISVDEVYSAAIKLLESLKGEA